MTPPLTKDERRTLRAHPISESSPISAETYERLLAAIERASPGKWRRAVDVCPVAVNYTIDNEPDALETIRRIEKREAREQVR